MKTLYKFSVKNGDVATEFEFKEISKAVAREGEMVYAREYAECVRNKLLTNAEALKIANERGGVLTEDEKDDFVKNLTVYLEKEKLLSSEMDDEQRKTTANEFETAKQKVLFYQGRQDEVYTYTAESKARDAVIMHYALSLTYSGDKPYFEGRDYQSRIKGMDNFDAFKTEVLKRGVWYGTAAFFAVPSDSKDIVYPDDRIKA